MTIGLRFLSLPLLYSDEGEEEIKHVVPTENNVGSKCCKSLMNEECRRKK